MRRNRKPIPDALVLKVVAVLAPRYYLVETEQVIVDETLRWGKPTAANKRSAQ
jgi:hypothetical protein